MITITNDVGAFQGDVAIIRLSKVPEDAKPTNRQVVAYGEATGHNHTIVGEVAAYEIANGLVFVVADGQDVQITHQEHDPITLATGIWFCPFESQVEYDGENERRVLD
jgi:hypothetical protein